MPLNQLGMVWNHIKLSMLCSTQQSIYTKCIDNIHVHVKYII